MSEILLISTYESGFQPLQLARVAACLRGEGLRVSVLDLAVQSVQEMPDREFAGVAFSVPMHTAMTLCVAAARTVRQRLPDARFCFFGLYAGLNSKFLYGTGLADKVLAGEIEFELAAWARALDHPQGKEASYAPTLSRLNLPRPDRSGMQPLSRYAHFVTPDGTAVPAGQTDASRGCLHRCSHCPVTPIYNGRFFIVGFDEVIADIEQQVAAGAGHISFGDPDFLNGPGHSLRITEWLHRNHPEVSFDFTAKVEHLLKRADDVAALKAHGAAFAVSAFESVQDHILKNLDKGHTVADMTAVLDMMNDLELPLHPTWIPFTPWTTVEDFIEFLDWIEEHGLVQATPPLQLSLRLLIPPRSRLLERFGDSPWMGPLEPSRFSYRWAALDPQADVLQKKLEELTGDRNSGEDALSLFEKVRECAWAASGEMRVLRELLPQMPAPPRLTEDWFC